MSSDRVTHSETSMVLNKPLEEVWDFVTVPTNWTKIGLGTWKLHGGKGEDDLEPVLRTTQPGEHFIEYMRIPDRFDFVGDWVVTISEKPHRWGFKSVKWYGPPLPMDIEVKYTLESIDANTTRWSRHRINTLRPGTSTSIDFLGDNNDIEEEYQALMKSYIERGIGRSPVHNPTPPHPRGWLATLQVS